MFGVTSSFCSAVITTATYWIEQTEAGKAFECGAEVLRESNLGDLIVEFWSFLRIRKKLWLAPVMMTIAVVNPLLRAPQGIRHQAIQKPQRESRKAKRKLEAQRKIVIAEAVIAEARNDPAFAAYIDTIVRKRITRPFDLTVMTEWVSTT